MLLIKDRKSTTIIDKNKLALEIKKWSELAEFYWKVVGVYHGIFNVVKVIIGAIALFSIANTITMSVYERVREIGTMRAIGTTRSKILILFITEGALVGILGGLLGVVVGVFVAYIINASGGIYISPPPGMSKGYVSLILIVPRVVFMRLVLLLGLLFYHPFIRRIKRHG